MMMQMSDGIGVNCGYCHNSRNFADWAQSTPYRWIGYDALRLVRDLNRNYLLPIAGLVPQTPHADQPRRELPVLPARQSGPQTRQRPGAVRDLPPWASPSRSTASTWYTTIPGLAGPAPTPPAAADQGADTRATTGLRRIACRFGNITQHIDLAQIGVLAVLPVLCRGRLVYCAGAGQARGLPDAGRRRSMRRPCSAFPPPPDPETYVLQEGGTTVAPHFYEQPPLHAVAALSVRGHAADADRQPAAGRRSALAPG